VLLAQVAEDDSARLFLLVLEQLARGLGDEHLPAARRGSNARGAVDGDAVVAAIARLRLAGVDPDPHAHLDSLGPGVRSKRALGGRRRVDSILRPAKGDEERVTLAVDLLATVRGEGGAQELLVIGEHLPVTLAQPLEQPRRALDVREQEGDGAALKLRREPPWRKARASSRLCQAWRSGRIQRTG
jgi:hypothetical protein